MTDDRAPWKGPLRVSDWSLPGIRQLTLVDEDGHVVARLYQQHLDSETWYAGARALVHRANMYGEMCEALEPFAQFACGDPEGTPRDGCDCHNCRARRVLSRARGDEV